MNTLRNTASSSIVSTHSKLKKAEEKFKKKKNLTVLELGRDAVVRPAAVVAG